MTTAMTPHPCPICGAAPEICEGLADAPFERELVSCATWFPRPDGDVQCPMSADGVAAWNFLCEKITGPPQTSIVLEEASPRDREVQDVALQLVGAFAFREAAAVLEARLKEMSQTERRQIERVFLDWCDLSAGERPDFLTFAHHRRNPEIERKDT